MLIKVHTAAKSLLAIPRIAKQTLAITVDLSLCILEQPGMVQVGSLGMLVVKKA